MSETCEIEKRETFGAAASINFEATKHVSCFQGAKEMPLRTMHSYHNYHKECGGR